MTSLVLGIACIYLAFTILRLPEAQFRKELNDLTKRAHGEDYYRLIRALVWGVGALGAVIIVLRFV